MTEGPAQATPQFQMLTLTSFAGDGVMAEGEKVMMAFFTDGPSIDVTMTKEQARLLATRLANAAK
jgi:hypothetical protein